MLNIYPQLIIRVGGGVKAIYKDDASNDTPSCTRCRCAMIGLLREKLWERKKCAYTEQQEYGAGYYRDIQVSAPGTPG